METHFEAMATLLFSDCPSTRKQECKNYFLDFARNDLRDYLHRCVNLLLSGKAIEAQTGYVLLNRVVKKGLLNSSSDDIIEDCYRRIFGWMQTNSNNRTPIPKILCTSLACFVNLSSSVVQKVVEMWEMAEKYRNYRYVIKNETTPQQFSNAWSVTITELLDYLSTRTSFKKDIRQDLCQFLRLAISNTKQIMNLCKQQRCENLQLIAQFIKLFNPTHESELEFILKILSEFTSDPQEQCLNALLCCYEQLFTSENSHLVFKHISIVFHNTKSLMDNNPSFLDLWANILTVENFKKFTSCVRDQLKTICQELMRILLRNIRQLDLVVGSYLLAMISADIVVGISNVVHGLVFYNSVRRVVEGRDRPSDLIVAAFAVMFEKKERAKEGEDARLYLTLLNKTLKIPDLTGQTNTNYLMSCLVTVNCMIQKELHEIILHHPETVCLLYQTLINIITGESNSEQILGQAIPAINYLLTLNLPRALTNNSFDRIIELCQLSLFKPTNKVDISSKEIVLNVACKFINTLNEQEFRTIVNDSIGYLVNVMMFSNDEIELIVRFMSEMMRVDGAPVESVFLWTIECIQSTQCKHFLPLLSVCLDTHPVLIQKYLENIAKSVDSFRKTSGELVMKIYLQLLEKGVMQLDFKKVFTVMINELKKDDVEYDVKMKYLSAFVDRLGGLKNRLLGFAGKINSGMIKLLVSERKAKLPADKEKSDRLKTLIIECMILLVTSFQRDFDVKAIADVMRSIDDIFEYVSGKQNGRTDKELCFDEIVLLIQALTYVMCVLVSLTAAGEEQNALIDKIHRVIRDSDSLLRTGGFGRFFVFYTEILTSI